MVDPYSLERSLMDDSSSVSMAIHGIPIVGGLLALSLFGLCCVRAKTPKPLERIDPPRTPPMNEIKEIIVEQEYVEMVESMNEIPGIPALVPNEIPEENLNEDVLTAHRLMKPLILLEQVLGRGTYGEVVLGSYEEKLVAVKRLRPDHNTPKNIHSLIQEIELMTRFNSPYLVHFVGAIWTVDMTDLMCVVEYMELRDLQTFLARSKGKPASRFPWRQKMACARHMALALVIHRDLKSPNVFLNQGMNAKLGDFGIARHVVEKSMSNAVGTYRWTAPEVLKGKYYSVKADIYSFGMVLSELDTHVVPYSGMVNSKGQELGNFTIMFQVMNGALKPSFSETCPPWLHTLALQCIAFDPAQRPTAQEIVQTIEMQESLLN